MMRLFLPVLFSGCVWITDAEYAARLSLGEESCTLQVWYADQDGDGYGSPTETVEACVLPSGYVANNADCDDTDAGRNPQTVWYLDGDEDGFGSAETTSASCEQPLGYVSDATDCNDTRASVNPSAPEDCATLDDDNCDGVLSSEDALGCTDWYRDDDADGYGSDTADPSCLCELPQGWSAEQGDCDDSDPLVSPLAEEVCGDGVDNNCDGGAGECQLASDDIMAVASGVWIGEARNDVSGLRLSVGDDLLGDGLSTLLVSAPRVDTIAADAGALYLTSGVISGKSSLSNALRMDGTEANSWFGYSTAVLDLDGEGTSDLVVGAPLSNAGTVYAFLGPVTASLRDQDADVSFSGLSTGDRLGWSISAVGDVDGDGAADILVGAYGDDTSQSGAGAAYLLRGPITATPSPSSRTEFVGVGTGVRAGIATAHAGDVNGDGLSDIVIGADRAEDTVSSQGAAYVVLGPATVGGPLEDADWVIRGDGLDAELGATLSSGDVNGDGLSDVLVGAPTSARGYVLSWDGGGVDTALSASLAWFEGANDALGQAMLAPGDLDGDGRADLVVGAPGAGSGGEVWVVYGPVSGQYADGDAVFSSNAADVTLGYALASPGDINGDTLSDLFVGAPNDDQAEQQAGAVWLVLGRGL